MEKLAFCLIVVVVLFGCQSMTDPAANTFNISGEMRAGDGVTLYLKKYVDGKFVTEDSASIADEKFTFSGTLDVPQRYYLSQKGSDRMMSFFLETGNMSMNGHIDSIHSVQVTGSELEKAYQAFEESMSVFSDRQQAVITRYWAADSAGDRAGKEAASKQMDEIAADQKAHVRAYLKENPNSHVSAYLAYYHLSFEGGYENLDSILAGLDTSLTNSPYVQIMAARSAKLKQVAVGQPALNFTLDNPEGEEISLSDFKGKYLLIDFWASWCGPCRAENPNVVAMYEEMKGKDFDILGVSFDTKRDKWLEAIEEDKLSWSHVSDLKGWQSEAGGLYAVNSIPHTVLLDKEGVIIAKDLRGDALRAKLEELLK